MYISNYRQRTKAVFLFFLVFLILCIARLIFTQIFRSNYLAGIAKKQHNLFVELEPVRGTIYDANLKPQAVNVPVDSIYASPGEIKDKDMETIINQVGSILNLDKQNLRDKLSRKKSFVWLARKVNPEASQAIRRLNLKGIGFIKESRRSYPNGYLASHIIGFAGMDNTGLEALESYCDKYLKGESGWGVFLRDARQKRLDIWEKMVSPKDGSNIILTIDEVIQYIAERELDKAYRTFHAKGGSIVVMDPRTGAILAMANRPTYDLNEHSKAEKEQMRNRAVCDMFEPGSVFKIVTLSAAFEENKVKESDRFFCENGSWLVAAHVLHDHQAHGWLTFRQVIEESSNIGTTKAAQILGPAIISRYVKLFGFGSRLGVDLPGEIPGMAKDARFWSKSSIAAIPIGQEVGVTSLQLAAAISAIANGGVLMKPFVVREVRDKYGEVIKKFSPVVIRRVISENTAIRAKKVLQGVVEEGTGKLAKIPDICAAGKTGTGQKLEANGSYSHSKFMASFIGFAPVDDPIVVVAITLDEPHPIYGGVVAAPVFKNVASDTIKYLKANQAFSAVVALNETKTAN